MTGGIAQPGAPLRARSLGTRTALLLALCSTAALVLFYSASWSIGAGDALARDAYVSVYLCAALLCYVIARVAPGGTIRWEYVGVAIVTVPVAIVVGPRSEAIGDLIALAFYGGIAAALTPTRRPSDTPRSALRWMDIVLIGIGVTTLATYAAFLGIIERSAVEPGLYRPLAPAAAVFVMLPAAATFKYREKWLSNPATVILLSGVAVAIAADIGAPPDVHRFVWAAAVWLMGMGATLALLGHRRVVQVAPVDMRSWWPAAAAGAVYALLTLQFWRVQPVGTQILIIGGTATAFLLLVRQIVALNENRRLVQRIAQIETREAVGRATADVAHEFNNLLTAMVGHIEILEREGRDDHSTRVSVRELRQATVNAVALTRSLLTTARPSPADSAVVDVNALVRQVVSMFQPSLGAERDISLNLSVEPCLTRGEHHALGHAVLNLLINAKDATPLGGSILIDTEVVPGRSLPAGLPLPGGDYVCVTIRDSGIGMTGEVLARAFDPFFTTKSEREGTGLGLPIVLSTVRRHGGLVDVQSSPGRGSTFSMWLPRA